MLTTLPTLPDLTNTLEQGASSVGAIGTGISSGVATATKAVLGTGGATIAGVSLTKIVMILLGLILIAAGIFSFKEARDVLVTAGKAAVI